MSAVRSWDRRGLRSLYELIKKRGACETPGYRAASRWRSPIPKSMHLEGGEIKSPDPEGFQRSYAIYNC